VLVVYRHGSSIFDLPTDSFRGTGQSPPVRKDNEMICLLIGIATLAVVLLHLPEKIPALSWVVYLAWLANWALYYYLYYYGSLSPSYGEGARGLRQVWMRRRLAWSGVLLSIITACGYIIWRTERLGK
jgi:hypothetical protein